MIALILQKDDIMDTKIIITSINLNLSITRIPHITTIKYLIRTVLKCSALNPQPMEQGKAYIGFNAKRANAGSFRAAFSKYIDDWYSCEFVYNALKFDTDGSAGFVEDWDTRSKKGVEVWEINGVSFKAGPGGASFSLI